MKKYLPLMIFLSCCAKKKDQNLEEIYRAPVIELPDDEELDELPEAEDGDSESLN